MLDYRLDIEERSTWILATHGGAGAAMPFHLSEIGKFYAGPEYFTRRSHKPGYYLVYTHFGAGRLHMCGGDFDLPTGTALLIDCTPLHDYHTVGERWTHYWMHLEGSGIAAYAPLLSGPVLLGEPREFADKFQGLLDRAEGTDVVAAANISHGISGLLTDLVEAARNAKSPKNRGHHTGIEAALGFIQEHYGSPISIDDITRNVNISKYHFVRLFRRYVGTTPYNYLIHYRVGQSKRLLCTTDSPVADIAQQVGYPSESNYISQFHRITGQTPAQFRKANLSYSAKELGLLPPNP